MDEERPMIHIRLPKPLLKRVDHVRVDMERDRARTIEKLLEMGLEAWGQEERPQVALAGAAQR